MLFKDLYVGQRLYWAIYNQFDHESIWEVSDIKGPNVWVKVIKHNSWTEGSVMQVSWPLECMEPDEEQVVDGSNKYSAVCVKIKQMDTRWKKQQQEKGNPDAMPSLQL